LMPRIERLVRLVPRDAALGGVQEHGFFSPAPGREARYLAWVPQRPPGNGKLPLLVLLHGADASAEDFAGQAGDTLQRLSQSLGLVIVCPDGGPTSWYLDSSQERAATFIAVDLLADADAHLPISTRRSIAGISMGGHGALTLALDRGGFVSAS